MRAQRRQSLTVVLAILLPVLLVAGIWLGGHPEDLPGFARSALVSDHSTRVVDEAIDRISSDYYRPIAKGQLANASRAGVVSSLGDPFSHSPTAKARHASGDRGVRELTLGDRPVVVA